MIGPPSLAPAVRSRAGVAHGPRPQLSPEFLAANKERRILDALARCVSRGGYRAVTVAHVVSEAGVARNTFYETFGSKSDAGRSLLANACPALQVGDGDLADNSAAVLAVEIAALQRLGEQERAGAALEKARLVVDQAAAFLVRPVAPPDARVDPELAKLPPGRHGLNSAFVQTNQRRRLLDGTARALYEGGYHSSTIAHITRCAAVSRRTFYEHFADKAAAVDALIDLAEADHAAPRFDLPLDSGLGSLWAEIVAAQFAGERIGAGERRRAGEEVLAQLDRRVSGERAGRDS